MSKPKMNHPLCNGYIQIKQKSLKTIVITCSSFVVTMYDDIIEMYWLVIYYNSIIYRLISLSWFDTDYEISVEMRVYMSMELFLNPM